MQRFAVNYGQARTSPAPRTLRLDFIPQKYNISGMSIFFKSRHAFSLIELSIVLVILGLLVGTVLSGQSLIRASELRNLSSEITRYQTAIYTFREKYFGLPGDITNATQFWGTDPDGCPTHTNRIAKTETCNGDGNGVFSNGTENFRAWQQLANANLITGTYSGVNGANTSNDSDPGINVPLMKYGKSNGFTLIYSPTTATYAYYGTTGNMIAIGYCGTWDCIQGAFKAEDTWNIDTKLDDGLPASGIIRPRNGSPTGHPNCSNGADNSAAAAATATYSTTDTTSAACGFYYMLK